MTESNLESPYQEFNRIFRDRFIEVGLSRLKSSLIRLINPIIDKDDLSALGSRYFKRRSIGICLRNRDILENDLVSILREFKFSDGEINRSLELIKTHSTLTTPIGIYIGSRVVKRTYGEGFFGIRQDISVSKYIRFKVSETYDGKTFYSLSLAEKE